MAGWCFVVSSFHRRHSYFLKGSGWYERGWLKSSCEQLFGRHCSDFLSAVAAALLPILTLTKAVRLALS